MILLIHINSIYAQSRAHNAEIVKKAASIFLDDMPPKDRGARQELLVEISPDSDAFEAYDEEFLAYEDDLTSLVSAYES